MAKKDTGLKSTLSLGRKEPIKKSAVNVEKTEAIAKKINADDAAKKSGKVVRLSTDLPEEDFIKFKMKMLMEGKNRKGQDIVRELIRQYINS
ncbi:hypothetical protein [Dyadobacter sp. BHUBP1]|uniref:hypothetical protein n=1 Tax=Dyadobacter sp. BHUBP1 TaxID=3424178 RepID=UPI003D34381C